MLNSTTINPFALQSGVKNFREAAQNAQRLYDLLGSAPRGRLQDAAGAYPGHSFALTLDDITRHLMGEITIGFDAATHEPAKHSKRRRTQILIFDIDRRANFWLPSLERELRYEGLTNAAICTSGSDGARAKIFVFFTKPFDVARVISLGVRIREAAARTVPGILGVAGNHDVAIYPTHDSGGLIRLGGINRRPDRHAVEVDSWYGLDGESRTLADVVPMRRLTKRDLPVLAPGPRQRFVTAYLNTPWTYSAGSKEVLKRLNRLAFEAYRLAGIAGVNMFAEWAQRIWDNSPQMRGPSPSGDTRAERTWKRRVENSWRYVSRQRGIHYIFPGGVYNVYLSGSPADVLVHRLREYARLYGVSDCAIGISYRRLGELLAITPMAAHKAVKRSVRDKRLVIVDRGTRGENGKPAILGIVQPGETPEQTLARAQTRGNVLQRRAFRSAK